MLLVIFANVPYRIRLCFGGREGVWPASNKAGWVTSVGGIPATPGGVAAGFGKAAFFSPVTVTAPSLEMVKIIKSPGLMPRTSSNAASNLTSPIAPILVLTCPRVNLRSCFVIKQERK